MNSPNKFGSLVESKQARWPLSNSIDLWNNPVALFIIQRICKDVLSTPHWLDFLVRSIKLPDVVKIYNIVKDVSRDTELSS